MSIVTFGGCLLGQKTAQIVCDKYVSGLQFPHCSLCWVLASVHTITAVQPYLPSVMMQARLGEKETLDVTLRYFEDRKSKLDRLEYYQERRLKGLGLLDDDGNNTWDDFFKDSIA